MRSGLTTRSAATGSGSDRPVDGGGTPSADSEYSDSTLSGAAYDGDVATGWDGCCAGYPDQELYYSFDSATRVGSYELVTADGECPVSWHVQIRNDDSSPWTTVQSVTGQECHAGTAVQYTLGESI